MRIFALLALLFFACSDRPSPADTEEQPQGETIKPSLVGQSLSMYYRPINSSDPTALSVAGSFNSYSYVLLFDSDSTLLMKSNKYATPKTYHIEEDTFYLGSKRFVMEDRAGTLFLRDSLFLIEMTPR